jgi:hypothetical protein
MVSKLEKPDESVEFSSKKALEESVERSKEKEDSSSTQEECVTLYCGEAFSTLP